MKKLKRPLSLAAAAVLCAALLTGCLSSHAQEESSSGSDASGQQTAWSEPEADQEYDAEQGKLDKDQYGSTVLAETEDAGQEYLDETLFIGDSNTVRMMAYGHTTLSNTIGVISMGIQHVPTKKCAYFTDRSGAVTIPEAVTIMQPKRIVITFGTNNTIGWSSDVFVSEYKEALEAIIQPGPGGNGRGTGLQVPGFQRGFEGRGYRFCQNRLHHLGRRTSEQKRHAGPV